MEENKDGIWFEDLLCDAKISGTEKLWKEIHRLADRCFFLIRYRRYPLAMAVSQYKVTILKIKGNTLYKVFEESGMELDQILRKIKKKMENYYNEHKDYLVQKPGGGEMV